MVYFLCKAYDSDRQNCYFALSLPVRGAWIEIRNRRGRMKRMKSLPVRGAWIEMSVSSIVSLSVQSLPVRGAWIEISNRAPDARLRWSLPVRGAWIEIYSVGRRGCARTRRSPCGERGLKFMLGDRLKEARKSLPVRGAWIEISCFLYSSRAARVAPRAGSVD